MSDINNLIRSMHTHPPKRLDELKARQIRLTNESPLPSDLLEGTQLLDPPCYFRKESLGRVQCRCPNKTVEIYRCLIKERCSVTSSAKIVPKDESIEICRLCPSRSMTPESTGKTLTWQVGITTVLQRKSTLLPLTLASLAKAGWPNPRLFIDGGTVDDWRDVQYPLSVRDKTSALGNWWLGMQELYVRNPLADRYMMVEDDVLFLPHARQYLDAVEWPHQGYLNLFTAAAITPAVNTTPGFFKPPADKMGLGALALVFNRDSIVKILASEYFIEAFRPVDLKTMTRKRNSHRSKMHQDGHVAKAMMRVGLSAYCHFPSVVQHLGGKASTMHHNGNPDSECFDPDYDLRRLIK